MPSCRLALLISPDASDRRRLAPVAYRCGLYLTFSANLRDACALLARDGLALIFCSDQLCGGNVPSSLQSLHAAAPDIPIIVVSQCAESSAYLNAMGAGAFDYVAWPLDPTETDRVVRLALARSARKLHAAA
jgi:DNA-binding NtrC family response regulator